MLLDHDMARLWADHHIAFGRWASDAAHKLGDAFRVLARVQYDRPWLRQDEAEHGPATIAEKAPCTRH